MLQDRRLNQHLVLRLLDEVGLTADSLPAIAISCHRWSMPSCPASLNQKPPASGRGREVSIVTLVTEAWPFKAPFTLPPRPLP